MKKILIIYHRVDYDGLFSALIARKHYLDEGCIVDLFGYNYGDSLSRPIVDQIDLYDEICMVDISFNDLETMRALYMCGKTVLIDHHETCINLLKSNGMSDWKGTQTMGEGACSLTFKYFYPLEDVPEIIKILSLYDVWNHDVLDWDNIILPLQYSLRTTYGMSLEQLIQDETRIFDENSLDDIIEDGKYILGYLRKTWKGWVKNYAFDVNVAGKFKGICMLTPQFGSMPFEVALGPDNDYQVFVCANKKRKTDSNGNLTGYSYSMSLYSTPDKIGNFSLGEYVKSISQTGSGGGHACACGMELTEEQFIQLVTEGRI